MNKYTVEELKLIAQFLQEQIDEANAYHQKWQKQGVELLFTDNENAQSLIRVSQMKFRDRLALEGINGMVKAWIKQKSTNQLN